MLIQIPRQNVRLGMYIEHIEGDWTDHPFWKTGFVITKPSDLERLHASAASQVVIDVRKGLAPAPSSTCKPMDTSKGRPASNAVQPTPEEARVRQISDACRKAVRDIFLAAKTERCVDLDRSSAVVETISRSVEENPAALLSLTRLKTMESYTFAHSVSVSALLVRFGRHLGLGEGQVQEIGMAGLLHDIGKMRIGDAILTKTSVLTEPEIALIRAHPLFGVEMLSQTADQSDLVIDVCRHHHERLDGTGYPDHLSGDAIGLPAKMTAICDVFDALTTVRPYKVAWSTERALSSMAGWTGHFDPQLLDDFAACLGRAPLVVPGPGKGPVVPGTAVNGYSDPSS